MTCQCAQSGWCPRRNAHVPASQWRKCQAGHVEEVDVVIAAIKKKQELSQAKLSEKEERMEKLKQRIIKRKAASDRLKGWIIGMRREGETGLGDTVSHLIDLCKEKGKKTLKIKLNEFLTTCACSKHKAIARLNKEHPYVTVQPELQSGE